MMGGDVESQSEGQETGKLELLAREAGPWSLNSYAIVCPTTGESTLVDPGAEPDALEQMLLATRPIAILLTHGHLDHIGALDQMRFTLNVPVMAHPGPHPAGPILRIDRELQDGDAVRVGRKLVVVRYAPGHTEDEVCYTLDAANCVVVGDTIFEGGPGRTDSAASFRKTLCTLQRVVLTWPDDTVCYPGHGCHFRLGDVRDRIEAFLANDHGSFFGDATWEM
jgi:glyoxylase-like metal-dependent hydrolase (beta-lactamase superfamily II)